MSVARFLARTDDLSRLPAGWHDKIGVPPSVVCLAAARQFAAERPDLAARARLYPTIEGGLLLEVTYDAWDLDVYFDADGTSLIVGDTPDGGRSWAPPGFDGALATLRDLPTPTVTP